MKSNRTERRRRRRRRATMPNKASIIVKTIKQKQQRQQQDSRCHLNPTPVPIVTVVPYTCKRDVNLISLEDRFDEITQLHIKQKSENTPKSKQAKGQRPPRVTNMINKNQNDGEMPTKWCLGFKLCNLWFQSNMLSWERCVSFWRRLAWSFKRSFSKQEVRCSTLFGSPTRN